MIRMKYFVYAVNYLLRSFFLISVIRRAFLFAALLIGSMLSLYDVAGQFGKNGIEGGQAAGARQWFIFIGYPGSCILS